MAKRPVPTNSPAARVRADTLRLLWGRATAAIARKDARLELHSRNTVVAALMFILPLQGAIEGVRKLFEKASEIRAAQREKIRERGRVEGHKEGRKESIQEGIREGMEEGRKEALGGVRERLQRAAVAFAKDPATGSVILTPEVIDYLLGEASGSGQ